MKKLIGFILFILCIFTCVLNLKVEAAELPFDKEKTNYCEYNLSGWKSILYIIPPYNGNPIRLILAHQNGTVAKVNERTTGHEELDLAAKIKIKNVTTGAIESCPKICINNLALITTSEASWSRNVSVHAQLTPEERKQIDGQSGKCLKNISNSYNLTPASENGKPSKPNSNSNSTHASPTCEGMIDETTQDFIRRILLLIQILVPLVLIVACTTDMVRAVMSNDDNKMKESYNRSVKRIFVAIAIFVIPIFVRLFFNIPGIREALIDSGIVDDPLCLDSDYVGSPEKPTDPPGPPTDNSGTQRIGNDDVGRIDVPKTWIKKADAKNNVKYKDPESMNYIELRKGKYSGSEELEYRAEEISKSYEYSGYTTSVSATTVGGKQAYMMHAKRDDRAVIYYFYKDGGFMCHIQIETDINDKAGILKYMSTFSFSK